MSDDDKSREQLTRELVALRTDFNRLKETHEQSESKYQQILETAPDAIIIVDSSGKIMFVNTQAETLFGYARSDLLRKDIGILLPNRFRDRHATHVTEFVKSPKNRPMGTDVDVVGKRKDGSEVPLDIALSHVKFGEDTWVTSAIRDVTERRNAELEKATLIAELQAALSKVKTLSGLLPICASCKMIRDDHGYWSQIEMYIAKHSDAEFTHGICPECINRLYPWATSQDSQAQQPAVKP